MCFRPRTLPVLLSIGLAALLAASHPGRGAGAAGTTLEVLRQRLDDPKADREKLRLDLLAFHRTHLGTPEAVQAGELLRRLPSPLDGLDPAAIPALDRFDWQPKGLVAALGEHRGRHGYPVSCVVITPDGKTVFSGGNSVLRVWDGATLRQRVVLGQGGAITAASLTRDGKTMATAAADASVWLWDLRGDKPTNTASVKSGTGILSAVAISPGGKLLAAGGADMLVRLFDLGGAKPQEKATLGGHAGVIQGAAFSPDGRTLATAAADGTVRVWDVTAKPPEQRFVLEGNGKSVMAVAFAPHEPPLTLAAGCADGTVRLWDVSGRKPVERAVVLAHAGYVAALAFTASGRTLATGGSDRLVKLWDVTVKVPREKAVLAGHNDPVTALSYTADGLTLATGGADTTVRLWNLGGGKPRQRFEPKGPLSFNYAVALAPDGRSLASGGSDRAVRLWDVRGRQVKERPPLRGDDVPVYTVAISPDSKLLAAAGGSLHARFWDVATGRPLRASQDGPSAISQVVFSPDSRQLLGSSFKSVCLWDVGTGRELRRFEGHRTPVAPVAFAPDGRRAISGSGNYLYKDGQIVVKDGVPVFEDCTLRGWDVEGRQEVFTLKDFTRPVNALAFTPDGTTILSGDSASRVRLWDATGSVPREKGVWQGVAGYVGHIAVSPDGKSAATTVLDGKVIVWDVATGKHRYEWLPPEYIGGLDFASDGRHLAVGLGTGPVYVIRLSAPGER
jgi:WD40 repeat protein